MVWIRIIINENVRQFHVIKESIADITNQPEQQNNKESKTLQPVI